MTIRIAVLGATGRTGAHVVREVLESDLQLGAAAVTHSGSSALGRDAGELVGLEPCGVAVSTLGPGCFDDMDVVVDFSVPEGLDSALDHLGARALVTGTTGLPGDTMNRLAAQASLAPVLTAANFSTGVNALLDLVARAARALPDWDVEIVEAHHTGKRDAPSGTALALGRSVANARGQDLDSIARHGRHGAELDRPAGEIGFHALRAGGVVGDHAVWIVGTGEKLVLQHQAGRRDVFARGALRAARWIVGQKPGRYSMSDVLGLSEPD